MSDVRDLLLKKRFGRLNDDDVNYLLNIGRLQRKLPARVECTLTFVNNLEASNELDYDNDKVTYTIKYLKLGHVLHGQEIFVYERTNIKQHEPLMISNYVIGTSLKDTDKTIRDFESGSIGLDTNEEAVKAGEIHAKFDKTKDKVKVRDKNNIYDKLYVQFIIEKEIAGVKQEIVYNQSYDQFLKEEFFDIFINSDKYTQEQMEEFLNYMTIQIYFNPKKNKIKRWNRKGDELDELELKLAVTVPTQYVIQTQGLVL